MSALKQFRHPGGFLHLLQVLEMSDSQKQRGLLQLIASEDPGWAHLLRLKILTVEKIFSWDLETLKCALEALPKDSLFQLYAGWGDQERNQIERTMSPEVVRSLRLQLSFEKAPTTQSVNMAGVKLIQVVRDLENCGVLDLNAIDPSLCWEPSLVA